MSWVSHNGIVDKGDKNETSLQPPVTPNLSAALEEVEGRVLRGEGGKSPTTNMDVDRRVLYASCRKCTS